MIMPITEKVMLRIKLKTQVKMNYNNILSPSLGVTISLFQHPCREQERRIAVRGRHGADRREQQDRRRKVVKPVTPAMPSQKLVTFQPHPPLPELQPAAPHPGRGGLPSTAGRLGLLSAQ